MDPTGRDAQQTDLDKLASHLQHFRHKTVRFDPYLTC